jgi:hypothetical protein
LPQGQGHHNSIIMPNPQLLAEHWHTLFTLGSSHIVGCTTENLMWNLRGEMRVVSPKSETHGTLAQQQHDRLAWWVGKTGQPSRNRMSACSKAPLFICNDTTPISTNNNCSNGQKPYYYKISINSSNWWHI